MNSNLPAAGQATQRSSTSTRSVSPATQGSRVTSFKPRSEISASSRTTAGTTAEAESDEERREKPETAGKRPCVEGELTDSSQEKDTEGRVWPKHKQHAGFIRISWLNKVNYMKGVQELN